MRTGSKGGCLGEFIIFQRHFYLLSSILQCAYKGKSRSGAGTIISAALDGTVVYSGRSEMQGHVIVIQHEDNVVSIYANNGEALGSGGETVKAGSPVAIVGSRPGDPGRPYLHFELWHNGHPLDPSKYINF